MKSFTPEELKKQWPGKYDNWKFAKNGKGEWIGCYKKQNGKIISKLNDKGEEISDIEIREITEISGFGLNNWSRAFKSFLTNFSSKK